jgi:hypothetical protein
MGPEAIRMTIHAPRLHIPLPRAGGGRARPGLARQLVGGFYLCMAGLHIGLVSADPQIYRHFADRALLPFVESAWSNIFMAHPAVWGLALAAGEVSLGILPRLAASGRSWGGPV